jgi:hypothetical protein
MYKVTLYAPAKWADTLTLFHLCQYMYSVIVTKEIPVYDPNTLIHFLQSQVSMCTNSADQAKAFKVINRIALSLIYFRQIIP